MVENKSSKQLIEVQSKLENLLALKRNALPKGFNETRFLQNCMAVLIDTKGIEKMQPVSIARTMLKGAFLGLDFFNKECYAIPYSNSLNFQTDYKGERKLAKKYSIEPIADIYAKLVKQGDLYEESIIEGKQFVNFKPKPFNNSKIIGAFAVCYYKDDSMLIEEMSIEEIEHIRDTYSKVPKGGAWKESFGEMAKKTVLRRLTKHIDFDFDSIEQQKTFDDSADMAFDNYEDVEPIAIPQPKKEAKESDKNVENDEITPEEAEAIKQQEIAESKDSKQTSIV